MTRQRRLGFFSNLFGYDNQIANVTLSGSGVDNPNKTQPMNQQWNRTAGLNRPPSYNPDKDQDGRVSIPKQVSFNKYSIERDRKFVLYRNIAPKSESEESIEANYKKTIYYHRQNLIYSQSYKDWKKKQSDGGRDDDLVVKYMKSDDYRRSKDFEPQWQTNPMEYRITQSERYKYWYAKKSDYYKLGKSKRELIFAYDDADDLFDLNEEKAKQSGGKVNQSAPPPPKKPQAYTGGLYDSKDSPLYKKSRALFS